MFVKNKKKNAPVAERLRRRLEVPFRKGVGSIPTGSITFAEIGEM
jgi:hypothetical protein